MRIPVEFYNHIRDNLRVSDIVRQKVKLTKKGSEYLGICPFHSEKTPSFTVNDAKRFYHCFGCSAHGDIIRFVSETTGFTYKDAAIKIAQDNSIELPKISEEQEKQYAESDHIHNILELAAQFFQANITEEVKQYLEKRGIKKSSIDIFSLGYADSNGTLEKFFEKKSIPLKDLLKAGLVGKGENGKIYEIFKNRIIFPIRNIYNKVVGFGGRSMGDFMPKYINSPETIIFKKGEVMYGENVAIAHAYKNNYFIVVEGYMDVIALHQAGFKAAVASLGTAVTDKNIQKLWRSSDEIISCLDGDAAGIRASNKLIELVLPHTVSEKTISFASLPFGMDPDDFIKQKSSKEFEKIIQNRISLSEMIWKREYSGKTFKTAESKSILEKKLEEYCLQIPDKDLQTNFRRYFKEMVWSNLVRKKNLSSSKEIVVNSSNIASTKQYSEIEILEYSICSFLLKYPETLNNPELKPCVMDMQLTDQALNDFKDYLYNQIIQQGGTLSKSIEDLLKNTSFYDTYLVLSGSDIVFLDLAFLSKNNISYVQVLKWLYKKHYLLLLKQEYVNTLKYGLDNLESRSSSYLKEIQKISQEINQLNDDFINS